MIKICAAARYIIYANCYRFYANVSINTPMALRAAYSARTEPDRVKISTGLSESQIKTLTTQHRMGHFLLRHHTMITQPVHATPHHHVAMRKGNTQGFVVSVISSKQKHGRHAERY